MKCEKCGYSLQIEYNVCPSCGTPNPFAKAHREDMQKYSEAFRETQKAVIDRTQKTTGVLVKFIISAVLIILSVIIIVLSGSTAIRDKIRQDRIKSRIGEYRNEYSALVESRDYVGIHQYIAVNELNRVYEFKDTLNLFNVCLYYENMASYLAEVTYPEYMKYAVRDYENYCESIIKDYDMIIYYSEKAEEYNDNQAEKDCINDCVAQSKVLIQSVFKLSDEQMIGFDDLAENQRINIILEKWPYERK